MAQRLLIAFMGVLLAACADASGDEKAESLNTNAVASDSIYEPMKIFTPIAGKSWRGEGTGPDGKPIVDVSKFEFILDGRALQSTHRLEGGDYGGRTIFFYDEAAKKYIYHYFTTAGFHTIGEITPTDEGFDAVESVEGHPTVTEVKSSMIIEGDVMRVETSHIDKDGAASKGDGFIYQRIDDPGALFSNSKMETE